MTIREYFPGANTPEGFYSYYCDIFKPGEAKKIIILKGGPGTGKSSFMKKVAKKMCDNGFSTELLHCSSDPDSLDGVCVREKGFLILDGTAPHITDPSLPGAVDEIINLGNFWDAGKLRDKKEEIAKLSSDISEEFKNAYIYLKSSAIISNHIRNKIGSDKKCMVSVLEKTKKQLGLNKSVYSGERRSGFLNALTYAGNISYAHTFAAGAKYIIRVIPDNGCTCKEFMNTLADIFIQNGHSVRTFLSFMNPQCETEHIYDETENTFVTTSQFPIPYCTPDETIDFSLLCNCCKLTEAQKDDLQLCNTLTDKTRLSLKKAKTLHDNLEKYYIPAMDFEKSDIFCENIIKNIL